MSHLSNLKFIQSEFSYFVVIDFGKMGEIAGMMVSLTVITGFTREKKYVV